MENKKPSKSELEKRIKSAIVLVPKDRETKSVYFDDKGLRLTVTDDYAVIATSAHQHVFNNITLSGYSRPYMYTRRFVEIALENDCYVKDAKGETSRSYVRLMAVLKEKEDKSDYNLAWYYDLWLMNIFTPLYAIDESEASAFIVYEQYLHNIARQEVILSEKQEDMTNVQFVDKIIANEEKFFDGMEQRVIFKAKTDQERLQDEMDAIEQNAVDKYMEESANGNE